MSQVMVNGSNRGFHCDEDDTILRSALRSDIQIPYECNSGGCGSCKVELLCGEVENLYPDAPGLSERDIRRGRILACQSRCKSASINIGVRVDTDEVVIRPKRCIGRLAGKREIARDLVEFTLELDSDVDYLAGQYFMLDIPGVGERAYSNSSIDDRGRSLQFIIKRMPGGKGSNSLFDCFDEGDPVGIDGPYGHSYLRQDIDRDILLIAGGAGLSPMVSIIRAMAQTIEDSRRVIFFYGTKALAELNEDYIYEIAESLGKRFSLVTALSGTEEETAGWKGHSGFIHDVVDRELRDLASYEIYLCGPPPMTAAAYKFLMLDRKVPFDRIHFDRFY